MISITQILDKIEEIQNNDNRTDLEPSVQRLAKDQLYKDLYKMLMSVELQSPTEFKHDQFTIGTKERIKCLLRHILDIRNHPDITNKQQWEKVNEPLFKIYRHMSLCYFLGMVPEEEKTVEKKESKTLIGKIINMVRRFL